MPRPRPDEIEPERPHDLLANLGRFRQTSHLTPKTMESACKLDESDACEPGRRALPVVQGHQLGSSLTDCSGDV